MAQFDWRTGVAFSAVIGAGVAALSGWKHTPSGQLAWDGEAWRWESPSYRTGSTEQELAVVADFQHMLLLRAENHEGASLWLWLERSTMPERWLAVRRAVYSPHRSVVAVQHDVLPDESSALPALPALPALAVSVPGVTQSAAVTRIKP